ncbi:MAG: glycosyltransferase [Myxococcota bacterium]|nr:glycosyltransferase [Myxococcota bacterium]
MKKSLDIAFFGSSLVSAYWNGAATYYRGMIRALAARGHRVTFYEPDAYERQSHRDIDDPPWCKVVVYRGDDETDAMRMLARAAQHADVLVKASGVGVYDELLEAGILEVRRRGQLAIFWDVDAAATLERIESDPGDPFRAHAPRYDAIFTYGGGDPVVRRYLALGARGCLPVYNALDPETHAPGRADERFRGDLGLLANRLPDRERRVEEFFLRPASLLGDRTFVLGGSGWDDKPATDNVTKVGHVYTADHNAFNASCLAVLNVARDSMASVGFSPATRVFEAAGAAACLITDAWEGIELFLEPEREVLVAADGSEVAEHLRRLDTTRARAIGEAARRRIVATHTYAKRAEQVESALTRGLERAVPSAAVSQTTP